MDIFKILYGSQQNGNCRRDVLEVFHQNASSYPKVRLQHQPFLIRKRFFIQNLIFYSIVIDASFCSKIIEQINLKINL